MKSVLNIQLIALFSLMASTSFGQQAEFSAHLNAGLFSFGGTSAVQTSFINRSFTNAADNYTNNPYGRRPGFSYGFAVQAQKPTKRNNLIGIQTGYEILRSNVKINMVSGYTDAAIHHASGKAVLHNQFVYVYPYFGHRFLFNKVKMDITAGPEFGFCLISREKGKATETSGIVVETDRERDNPGLDVRARAGATLSYKKLGLSAGYSYGLSNYTGNMDGADSRNSSRLIRFGLAYQIH